MATKRVWMVRLLFAIGVVMVVTLPFIWREYVGDSLIGGYSGRDARAMATSCDGIADGVTVQFAHTAGDVYAADGGYSMPEPDGCYVNALIPRSAGPDPMEAIDKEVGPEGWERTEETTWVRSSDGFTVKAQKSECEPEAFESWEPEPTQSCEGQHLIDLWGSVDD